MKSKAATRIRVRRDGDAIKNKSTGRMETLFTANQTIEIELASVNGGFPIRIDQVFAGDRHIIRLTAEVEPGERSAT